MASRLIRYLFYFLFLATPLFFTPLNNELFEYNKMMLVYGVTIVIVGLWLLRMIAAKQLLIKRTPLDIPILLFYASQILSTVFSIDPHTSIWGYYSRSNGGLLSITAYLLLYYALVSNIEKEDIRRILKSILAGGLLVSIYAIPEHFGMSPSCLILTQTFTADCWVQDVQARVFATLGQPNWLAAYLGMLIFIGIYFFLVTSSTIKRFFYYFLTLAFYAAFTFTYSRGATLGIIAGAIVFIGFISLRIHHISRLFHALTFNFFFDTEKPDKPKEIDIKVNLYPLQLTGIILLSFIVLNLLFGSALSHFKLIQEAAPPPRPSLVSFTTTQLESGGTESGTIRLIVWKGAWEIFRHYPLFGSGVETFAYSYYNFRPMEHNLVSEWDFLYNKAHNEYLNYLATTGIVGLGTYLLMIAAFIFWSLKKQAGTNKKTGEFLILNAAILAGYLSYLVQNAVQFSVVMIALLFYIFPGLVFIAEGNTLKPLKLPEKNPVSALPLSIGRMITRRSVFRRMFSALVILIMLFLLMKLLLYWFADTLYKSGNDYADSGNAGRAYNDLLDAVLLNKGEPLYRNDFGYAAASAAVALADIDATQSAELIDEAQTQTELSLQMSPNNLSLWRTAIRTYYQLSLLDKSFEQKTIDALDTSILLAPTDPKLLFNKALVLSQFGKTEDAVTVMQKAIEFKPNYRDARLTLSDFYKELNQTDKAKEQLNIVLNQIPNDPDALKRLEEL